MAIELRILGWSATGFRCPDHSISFEVRQDQVYPVTLIQMPNGTGKTTTLELVRAALSGAAMGEDWDEARVKSMRKKGATSDNAVFQLTLLHNARRVTITMTFDFDEGTVSYSTTVSSGMKAGFHPPRDLARFFRREFVPFFVFDGELAERLLSREHTNAESVIDDLFQLRLFDSVAEHVRDYWRAQTERAGATEERGLSRRSNRVALLRTRLATLLTEQAAKRQQREELDALLKRKKAAFDTTIAAKRNLGERLRRVEAEVDAATASITQSVKAALGALRKPHGVAETFADEMIALKGSLDRVKLPESAAKEFFEELAAEDHCVCGRPLDSATRKVIRERANRYLGSEDVSLLNAIKADVALLLGGSPYDAANSLNVQLEQLVEQCRVESELKTTRDAIRAEGIGDDPGLESTKNEIVELEKQIKNLDEDLEKYDDPSDTAGDGDIFGIKVIRRRLDDGERKLGEVTKTLELKEA